MGTTVCLDAGHGGKDPGAVGNGLLEKELTLAIAHDTARILRGAGLNVIMTRGDDRFIDLNSERTPACDISVSIHINAGGGQGLETWVSLFNKAPGSKALGQAIQNNVLSRVAFRNRGVKTKVSNSGNADYLYMLRKPRGIPVLVECGFIDSPVDAELLRSKRERGEIAAGIAAGILEYLVGMEGRADRMLAKLNLNTQVDLPEVNVQVNGKPIAKGVILNIAGADTTYIAARDLAEALGANVGWDNATKTVLIKK